MPQSTSDKCEEEEGKQVPNRDRAQCKGQSKENKIFNSLGLFLLGAMLVQLLVDKILYVN